MMKNRGKSSLRLEELMGIAEQLPEVTLSFSRTRKASEMGSYTVMDAMRHFETIACTATSSRPMVCTGEVHDWFRNRQG